MTVKILLDPIYTAAPSRCSTFVQFATFMLKTLEKREDVFFYCLMPDWDIAQEELDWMPQHERIRYVKVPQHKDRTKEYVTLRDELDAVLAFNGQLWDFDVVVTVRSGLAALFKMLITSPRQVGLGYLKEVWVIEEMPLMTFKSSVLTLHPCQDLFTLQGYLAADRVMVMSYHEKGEALKIARNYLTPSNVISLQKKLKEVVPVQFSEYKLKDPEHFYRPGEGQRFTIAYVGRLMAATTNLDKVYSAMTNQWIMRKGDNVRMVVCTNSAGGKKTVQPPDYMEKFYASRDEFWRMAREEMHLLTLMHEEAGFLLSMMEPVMLGTPVVVLDAPWSRGQLGPDYPFYVKNETELYAIAKAFYEDYAGMYERFATWFKDWFEPTYKKRFTEDMLYDVLDGYIQEYQDSALDRFAEESPGRADNAIVKLMIRDDPQELDIKARLAVLAEGGELKSLQRQLDPSDRDSRGLVWATPWNHLRCVLKAFYGYEDAGTTPGHMRKVSVD